MTHKINTDEHPESLTPWYYQKFYRYSFSILLVLTIIFLAHKIIGFLSPVVDFLSVLLLPILIALLFYYLLRPIVNKLKEWSIPGYASITFIYLVIGLFLVLFVAYISPVLANQITAIANTSVDTLKDAQSSQFFLFSIFNANVDVEIRKILFEFFQQVTTSLSKNFLDLLSYLPRIAAVLAVIPFIVFYLLKDDHDFSSGFLHYVPEKYRHEVKKILQNMDETLASYIRGLVLVSTSLGVLLFLGYWIIGLNYALILAVIALVFTTIPFLGPFLAIAPALFVGFADSPWMALKVVIVFIVVQQCESNIISPQVIGQRLHVHPLTIILLLLAAGSLWGLVGLIFATPMYAVAKLLIGGMGKMYRLKFAKT
jgi:predicted PurR-regulated permease PerM